LQSYLLGVSERPPSSSSGSRGVVANKTNNNALLTRAQRYHQQ
jgi:hypothetical protein